MNSGANRRMSSTKMKEKPKDVKYVLRRLWDYMYYYKWWLLLALTLTILANLFALIGPVLSGHIVDDIKDLIVGQANKELLKDIFIYASLMLGFYILSSVFSYILAIIMMKMSKKIVFKMRADTFSRLMSLPISFFDSYQTGDIISRMSYDIDTINTSLSSDLIQICTSAITIVGSLIMMIVLSPLLVLVFAITIPISLLFTRFMLKHTQKMFRARSRTLGELNGFSEEMITGIKPIKAYATKGKVLENFDEYNTRATTAAYKAEFYGSITGPGVNFVNNLSLSLVCMFGSILLLTNPNFTVGNLASFVQYSRRFSGPINEIANIFVDIQSALAAGERVFKLIDATPESLDKEDAISLEEVKGDVKFSHVKFGYIPERTIIQDLSFEAMAGKTIAIVGPTGAGKTTIVNLLMRFYDIWDGEISLDNTNITNIKRADLRKSYAMVLQDTWLFQGTVYENIKYGKDDATLDDVINACKAARVDGFVTRLKEGYDTVLVEGGINISKGQKQLLTIARAMLLDANMLILDEATSNVDTSTEAKIQEAMKDLMIGKTCFIIAHRLSTIKNADLILVVNDGEIVEMGKHQELLNNKGFYHQLYYSQFE